MATIGELFVKLRADTSNFEQGMKQASQTSSTTTSSMKSQAAKLAQEYIKSGMTQSDAMKKAWAEIKASSENGTNSMKNDLNNTSPAFKTFKAVISQNLNQIGQQMTNVGKNIVTSIGSIVTTAAQWTAEIEQQKFVYNNLDSSVQKAISGNTGLATSLGMTKQQYLNNATAVSDFLARMGMTSQSIADQSGKITTLTADMAAFADVDVTTATSDFKSALMGNFEAVDKYGLSLSVATINQGEYSKSLGKTWDKMSQGQKAQAILSEAFSQSTTYTGLAKQESDSYAAKMKLLKQQLMETATTIGSKLFPVLEPLVSAIANAAKSVADWASEHPKLTQGILLVIGVIGGLMAVGGPLLTMFASLSAVALALNIELLPLIGIIIGVTAAISALVGIGVALWQNWDTIKAKALEVWNSICESVSDAYNDITTWLSDMGTKAVEWATNLYNSAVEAGTNFLNTITTWFSQLPGVISTWLTNTLSDISTWCNNTWNTFTTWCTNTITSISEWFSQLPYRIGFVLGTALGTIMTWGVNTYNYFVTNVPIWIDAVVNFFSQLPDKIWNWLLQGLKRLEDWGTQSIQKAKETGQNILDSIVQFFSQLPGKIWSWLQIAIDRVSSWGTQTKQKAKEAATTFLNNVINTISQLPGQISTWLNNTISKVSNFVSQMASKARSAANQFTTNLVNGVKSIPGKMTSIGRDIVKGIWNGISGAGSWLKNQISGFANGVISGFKKAFKIHSPSRLMRDEIGKFIPQGIAVGIEADANSVYDSLDNLAVTSAAIGSDAFNGVIGGYNANLRGINTNSNKNAKESSNGNGLIIKIENFNNNREQDIKDLVEEIAFYLKRKNIAIGG